MMGAPTAEDCRAAADLYELQLPQGGSLALGGNRRALVMGILNITPDSFADGGLYHDRKAAIAHAEEMAEHGADVIDIGGESTRPGSDPVSAKEQIGRVIPVISQLASRLKAPISIDTTSAEVAKEALDAGAAIVNDISALRMDPNLGPLVAERRVPVVLMHMLGRPKDMQVNPSYGDVVAEVCEFLRSRMTVGAEYGICREQIIVDPGLGFGKTFAHNMELLRHLSALRLLSRPILVGASRKAMLGHILGVPPAERDYGTAATVAAAVDRGAAMVRVHDVRCAVHVVKVMAAIQGRSWD